MDKEIIEEYGYIHDNEIVSYEVDIYKKQLQIKTKYYDKEDTIITFEGLLGHHFQNVTYSNVIFNILQVSIDCFIEENKEELEIGMGAAFPIYGKSCETLREYLKERKLKVFIINAVLGLKGFVIAKEIFIKTDFLSEAQETERILLNQGDSSILA